jgi:hypothetical protein
VIEGQSAEVTPVHMEFSVGQREAVSKKVALSYKRGAKSVKTRILTDWSKSPGGSSGGFLLFGLCSRWLQLRSRPAELAVYRASGGHAVGKGGDQLVG